MTLAKKFKELEGRFDIDPNQESKYYSGIYTKKMFLPKGYVAMSHKHKYDHLSILAQGKCKVITDDGESVYSAGSMIEIKAGLHHEIVAIEDTLWFCIHSTDVADDANGVLIERV